MSKNVLITGAGTGIGKETALLFAKNGYNVILSCNKSYNLAVELSKEIIKMGVKSLVVKADLTIPAEIDNMFCEIYNNFSKIDVVVNNAGVSHIAQIQDTSLTDYNKIFDVNMKSIFLINNHVLPKMIENKWGRIINVSSMWGERGASCEVVYSASKSALIGYTKALAKEVGLSGITVNCVLPGVIDTEMNANLSDNDIKEIIDSTSVGRIGKPIDVANAILFLASDNSSFITGQSLGVDGGFIG